MVTELRLKIARVKTNTKRVDPMTSGCICASPRIPKSNLQVFAFDHNGESSHELLIMSTSAFFSFHVV
jgi:hypothetical protein